jgi:predicted transcriptional regulator
LPKLLVFDDEWLYNSRTLRDISTTYKLRGKYMTNVKSATTVASKSAKLLTALKAGEQLTAKQIAARFGIGNPTATVSDLRLRGGFAIYANPKQNAKGQTVTRYRLGTPTKAVVAAGYRALAAAKQS